MDSERREHLQPYAITHCNRVTIVYSNAPNVHRIIRIDIGYRVALPGGPARSIISLWIDCGLADVPDPRTCGVCNRQDAIDVAL